jgi:hypothetical protein
MIRTRREVDIADQAVANAHLYIDRAYQSDGRCRGSGLGEQVIRTSLPARQQAWQVRMIPGSLKRLNSNGTELNPL